MSYDPSENVTGKTMQIDDFVSSVSSDITTHSRASFVASNIFFIEEVNLIEVNSSISGRLQAYSFVGSTFGCCTIECNANSSFTTQTDEVCIGVNIRNTSLVQNASASGAADITSIIPSRLLWRIA